MGQTDAVRMGPLLVQHGNRYGKYAAKNVLADMGFQLSTMFGHIHELQDSGVFRGEDYDVQAIASGCLCDYPHYEKGRRPRKKQALGTAIAAVDLCGREVSFNNLLFQRNHSSLWVTCDRQRFETQVAAPEGEVVTFERYLQMKAEAKT